MRTLILFLLIATVPLMAERTILSLDGQWQVADSVEPDAMPSEFAHQAPVPGLTNLATPPFPDVDRFDSAAVISNRIREGKLPESAMPDGVGVSLQERNYFWYRTTFRAPAKHTVARLKVNKAQFGTAVWVNGTAVGEHLGCFTAGFFDITEAIYWSAENTVIIRIGAHPAVLPPEIPAGDDFEKNVWTPGIYDSVSVILADNPVIETIQIAPRIQTSEIIVQTKIRNHGADGAYELRHTIRSWRDEQQVTQTQPREVYLEAGAEETITQTITIPRARLWSPEDPFLYVLASSTSGDNVETRFGMREFRFDTPTKRAYLNGRPYFLRGSNITLHRFFEDPDCGDLPWREEWVRKLLSEIPKKMNWNTFRFCIGPVPDRWLEIADETGLLIQNEFFIWTGHPRWAGSLFSRTFDAEVLRERYAEWMRDNWNHPSVVVWDANNESFDPIFAEEVIPAVRGLDLSDRPWENSYNVPAGPDDPVEDHPYLFARLRREGGPGFQMQQLVTDPMGTNEAFTPSGHATILNEYGWLWLNRDGSPTVLTENVYQRLLGPNATADERFRLNAYLLGGLTEFWRAHRTYAGVLHFVYLTSSYPGAYTSDHFRDVKSLELDPYFADYVGEAFKPVGVYINFWVEQAKAGSEHDVVVMVVNDNDKPVRGRLRLAGLEKPLDLAPLGQRTYRFLIRLPETPGPFELKAVAEYGGRSTTSRRSVKLLP